MIESINKNQLKSTTDSIKNKYGQYFTPEIIADFMINLADINSNSNILEPSSGKGVFIELLMKRGINNILGYELDKTLISNNLTANVKNESYVSAKIKERFDLNKFVKPFEKYL